MKTSVLLLCAVVCLWSADAAAVKETPIGKVVKLLHEMEGRTMADGKLEQKLYDKYACWCEKTLARKARDIANAKKEIERLQNLIYKLNGDLGSSGAEIEQLKKDIAANLEAQREATEVRDKEYEAYAGERTEAEQCLGALEAAITVLTGAGTGKKKAFLENSVEVQLMSVAAGVRGVISRPLSNDILSAKDFEVVRQFVENPEKFGSSVGMSAAQVSANPFGDYAPQSTQIQGILKGMYDAFAHQLEKANGEEGEAQKGFEEYMATKKKELDTLKETLQVAEKDNASKKKLLAESEENLDNTKDQLEADEKFFEETKAGCKAKAVDWAGRTQCRTTELQGIIKAKEILSEGDTGKGTGLDATAFLQVDSETAMRTKAYSKLQVLAARYKSLGLARIAVAVRTGGHFDKVIEMIDKIIVDMRQEGQDDIDHRDRCEAAKNKNKNDAADYASDKEKAEAELTRQKARKSEITTQITNLEEEIGKTKAAMADLLKARNEDVESFKKGVLANTESIKVVKHAIVTLSEFYKDNDIKLQLVQAAPEREYTVDQDKAPEADFSGCGSRKEESGGIVAILEMIVEDMQHEIEVSKEEDAAAQATYEKQRAALQEDLDTQLKSKLAFEQELQDCEETISDLEEARANAQNDIAQQGELKNVIKKDCNWIIRYFEVRRKKRKIEIAGCVEAKNVLAGSADDTEFKDYKPNFDDAYVAA